MLTFFLIALFAAVAASAVSTLVDGFLRARNAHGRLRRELAVAGERSAVSVIFEEAGAEPAFIPALRGRRAAPRAAATRRAARPARVAEHVAA